ncbi:hypothetical protein T4A_7251 [Trichinella pseudospiralis]|uniref:Uncharacterized protein n=1 Tax=Trichinella pseudospiralis TaxID=6337 RepID=A0A0V1EBC6_TRIPS|nr:hypothetical protein T4A_7251 [Trichinella pseudospiralis]
MLRLHLSNSILLTTWCTKEEGSIDLFRCKLCFEKMNLKSKRFMSFEVVFQFCQSAGHSFMHIAWFCLFGRKFSHLKIDAFPRLEASLNNELSEPPPPLPPYPVTRFGRAN